MLKLPIIYVMLGFRIIGAPEPNPGWQPLGVYETEAACLAAEEEMYKRENIHRVSLKCVRYGTNERLLKDGTGDNVVDRIPPCGKGGARQSDETCPKQDQ
jgi:hypothetical protein